MATPILQTLLACKKSLIVLPAVQRPTSKTVLTQALRQNESSTQLSRARKFYSAFAKTIVPITILFKFIEFEPRFNLFEVSNSFSGTKVTEVKVVF